MSNEMNAERMERLREEYEDGLFRYLMASYAEERGKEFKAENDALKKSGEFNPTPEAIRRFDRAMDRAFRKRRIVETSKRAYRALNKVAVFIVAAVVALTATAMAVDNVRVEVLNFLIGIQDEYTSLRLDSTKGNNLVGDNLYVSWSDGYILAYIPEKYKITSITNTKVARGIRYENESNEIINYSEYSADAAINLDTENADIENIKVNGYDALLVTKDGVVSVTWSDGQRIFLIISQLNPDELLKVAENVKPIN